MNAGELITKAETVTDSNEYRLLLCDHVRNAVLDYTAKLDGIEISNLYEIVMLEVERPLIMTTLELCGHNQTKAAQMLGISRSTLRKKLSVFEKL